MISRLITVVLFLISINVFTQRDKLNIGINGGITNGSLKGVSSNALGADFNYLFPVNDFLEFGPSLSFIYFNTNKVEELELDPFIYMPIGVAFRFTSLAEKFYVGTDAGYAVGISPEGDDGGVYIKPQLGYSITDDLKINLFFSGVKKTSPTYSYIGLGLEFNVLGSDIYYGQ